MNFDPIYLPHPVHTQSFPNGAQAHAKPVSEFPSHGQIETYKLLDAGQCVSRQRQWRRKAPWDEEQRKYQRIQR